MSESQNFTQTAEMINVSDNLVILVIVALAVYFLSFFIPAGKFDTQKVNYQ